MPAIRDVFWIFALSAVAAIWWADRSVLANSNRNLRIFADVQEQETEILKTRLHEATRRTAGASLKTGK